MEPIAPGCLAKIIKGAVAYAQSLGFPPHANFGPASMLLGGIDPSTCPEQFTFGRKGKPMYIRGPSESLARAQEISRQVQDAGGHFLIGGTAEEMSQLGVPAGAFDRFTESSEDGDD